MTNVTVLDSAHRGVTFLDTFGANDLTSVTVKDTRGGSGLHFEFENSQCHPCSVDDRSHELQCTETQYVVHRSTIRNCKATACTTSGSDSCMGGGMAVIFKGSVSNVRLNISESSISDNEATLAGGGGFVGFFGDSVSNAVFFVETVVTGNTVRGVNLSSASVEPSENCEVWTSGGGVAVLFSDSSLNNKIAFLSLTITGNAANSGGGVAATFRGRSFANIFTVQSCNVSKNTVTSAFDNPCARVSSSLRYTGNGGGLAFAFAQEASGNAVDILSSTISSNSYTAIGGGYSVVFYDKSSLNTVRGTLNVVEGNRVIRDADMCKSFFRTHHPTDRFVSWPSGGGGGLLFLNQSSENSVILLESFSGNSAVRGGGLFVGFHNLTAHNEVVVSGVVHSNWLEGGGTQRDRSGGGAMVQYKTSGGGGDGKSTESNNVVRFQYSFFLNNNCSRSFGGAVAIVYESYSVDLGDRVSFGHSIFSNNLCRYGRAIASTTVKHLPGNSNFNMVFLNNTVIVNILESNFKETFEEINKIFELDYYHDRDNPQELIVRVFTAANYSVQKFDVEDFSNLQGLLRDGQGIVYLRSVTMHVKSTLTILCGGLSQGIFFIDSFVTFSPSSNLVVKHCISTHGGALALYGNSFLFVSPGASLAFSANRALRRGGAVYVRTAPSDVSRAGTCFLQYDHPLTHPALWTNVSIKFANNSADIDGHSIYVRDARTCLPTRLRDSLEVEKANILCWANVFTFSPPPCGPSDTCAHSPVSSSPVSSSPQSFVGSNNTTISQDNFVACATNDEPVNRIGMSISPGNTALVPISTVLDIFSSNISTILLASISMTQVNVTARSDFDISIDGSTEVKPNGEIKFRGRPFPEYSFDSKRTANSDLPQVLFQAVFNHDVFAFIDVNLECCPPGFVFNETSLVCQCDPLAFSTYLESCNAVDGFKATLKDNFWLGYLDSATGCNGVELYYSPCPVGFCSSKPLPLPVNRSTEHLNKLICGPLNRKGRGCGQCKEGYSVPINFDPALLNCKDCHGLLSPWGGAVWIISEWIPMFAVVVMILLFNVNLLNGHFNAFLLTIQLLPILLSRHLFSSTAVSDLSTVGQRVVHLTTLICQVWNLEFFSRWLPPFCLSSGSTLSALQVLTVTFVVGLVPLCLVCIFVLVDHFADRCCKPLRAGLYAIRKFKHNFCGGSQYDKTIPTVFMLSYSRIVFLSGVMITFNDLRSTETDDRVRVFFWDGTVGFTSAGHNYYWTLVAIVAAVVLVAPTLGLLLYPTLPMTFDAMKDSRYKSLNWVGRLTLVDKCMHGMFSAKCVRHFLDVCQSSFKPRYRFFASFFLLQRVVLLGIGPVLAFNNHSSPLVLALAMTLILSAKISIFRPYRRWTHNLIDLLILYVFALVIMLNMYRLHTETNTAFQMLLVGLLIAYAFCCCAVAVWRTIPSRIKESLARGKAACAGACARSAIGVRYRRMSVQRVQANFVTEESWRARDSVVL